MLKETINEFLDSVGRIVECSYSVLINMCLISILINSLYEHSTILPTLRV